MSKRGRPAGYSAKKRDKAVELRKQGCTNREVAERLKLTIYQIEWIMRSTRNVHKWYYYRPPRSTLAAVLTYAVNRYGSIHIEEGLNDGVIATVADLHTGEECDSMLEAIKSAEAQALAVEAWRFAG